ncbi:MAG TPA: hypothetical protein ENJ09_08550 [Planctomycetes bacterium]|nr:hypothetical protein [Planctomycetota bacterium]
MTTPGIPNEYTLSTTCFGSRLLNIQDQVFAAVGMGFRRLELGLAETPPSMDGLEDSRRETGVTLPSMVAGCRDPLNGNMAVERLGSLVPEERDRALNSVRRHIRLARTWNCPRIVVRGSKVEDPELRAECAELRRRWEEDGPDPELREEVAALVERVQHSGHKHIEQLCRSLHELSRESPDVTFALEPGRQVEDLLGFEAMGWVLEDLEGTGLTYWHDVGRIHLRERLGLPAQGEWLDRFGSRMEGIHLQDATADETGLPVGSGEVDFKLLEEYVPSSAERVVDVADKHGRAEILASVRFLLDHGF